MAAHSKRYRQGLETVDRAKRYPLADAMTLLKSLPGAKFDESVDLSINLGVDPKHADQMVRGSIVLPHGSGRSLRVLVFAKGDKEKEAREAGADVVGAEELAKKIQDESWLEFDRVVATPDLMGVVGRLGKILGPRGLMPNPKLGTVTMDVGRAVRETKAGKVEYKVDKSGIIHVSIGKRSFSVEALVANASALLEAVLRAKPASSKGTYLKKVSLSSTMSPGIPVDPSGLAAAQAA